MVASLFHPLNIFILGLGGGFIIPLLSRLGKVWVSVVFVLALTGMTLISGVSLFKFLAGALPIEILTGGATPPYSINLRVGLAESVFSVGVNLVALLGAVYFVRAKYSVMLIYLIMVMGIQGMVMTRDLFNLFVFLEIVSVATYGLLGLPNEPAALSATFKYLMATVIASTFFLLGTVLLYAVTGMVNIDDLIGRRSAIAGPIGFAALMFLLASLLVELKPFPANGWGLDVYVTTHAAVAAQQPSSEVPSDQWRNNPINADRCFVGGRSNSRTGMLPHLIARLSQAGPGTAAAISAGQRTRRRRPRPRSAPLH